MNLTPFAVALAGLLLWGSTGYNAACRFAVSTAGLEAILSSPTPTLEPPAAEDTA